VTAHQAVHSVAALCRPLGVSPSGYYAWRKRPSSPRARADVELTALIEAVHRDSRGTYGAPRIHAEFAAEGIHIGRKRVARLMRVAGLQGVSRRKFRPTVRDETARPAPDLVDRQFTVASPDRLWVADITYVPTWAGVLYLAVALDAWSRRVIGWVMESHLRTELAVAALDMAVAQRRPTDVIHHSDQGCQYTSLAFGGRCRAAGVRPSMGSVGDAYDNALCESFFATLECELLDRQRFPTQAAARLAVFDFIEGWYNPAPPPFGARLSVAMIFEGSQERADRTVTSESTIDQGYYLTIPLGGCTVMVSKAVHRPPSRGQLQCTRGRRRVIVPLIQRGQRPVNGFRSREGPEGTGPRGERTSLGVRGARMALRR
jgi:putative transposase